MKAKGGVAQLKFDFKKFYETVPHSDLERKAEAGSFPWEISRLALHGYQVERRVVFEKAVSDLAFPTCGIVAGDPFATTMVKIHYAEELGDFKDRWEGFMKDRGVDLDFKVYIDDLAVTMRGDRAAIITWLPRAEADLREVMCGALGGTIAEDKTNLTASDKDLWEQINKNRGQNKQTMVGDDSFLGIDTLIAQARGRKKLSESKWARRWATKRARQKRLARLKVRGNKALKIFREAYKPPSHTARARSELQTPSGEPCGKQRRL